MFIVEGKQADAQLREQGEIDAIVTALATDAHFKPVLRSMVDAAREVSLTSTGQLSVAIFARSRGPYRRPEITPFLVGDPFLLDQRAFLLQPIRNSLYVWEMRPHLAQPQLDDFCSAVASAARAKLDGRRLRGMNFDWKAAKHRTFSRLVPRSRFYREAKLETKAPEYSPIEAEGARLLVRNDARSSLLRLAQVGKARSIDTADEENASLTKLLLEKGLIRREYLILCRQDSHTICVVPDRVEIDGEKGSSFVCTICGRPFKDELVQEVSALTELGKRLLSGSRWMTIWITELLIRYGIDRERIAWNPVAAGDELDIMTDALGPRVFFELKDREFGLGDAYPFAYRVTRHGGSFGVVATTDRVAEEASRFFKEQQSGMEARIVTLERPRGIEEGLARLIDQVSRSAVSELLMEVTEPLAVDLLPIIDAWMARAAASCTGAPGGTK